MKVYFSGGLNESQTPDINEAAEGSFNFDLSTNSYKLNPRSPFDLKGTAPNDQEIKGLMQLVKRDDTETTLVQAGAVVYKWDGASTFSSEGACDGTSQLRDTYWSLGDYLVITDLQKATAVKRWDGSTFSTQTTGLGSDLYAKYGIVHNGRVWLFNVKTSTDTPHLLVASAFENPTSYDTTQRATTGTFSSTGLEAFYMLSPDLRPINGVAKTVAGDLIISTLEGGLFKLTGTNANNYAFVDFYPGSQAVGDESLASTGNDVVYMRKGGNIESLSATEKYGDVAADDLSRWITETVKDLTESITIYDQKNQKVLFFVSGKVLVFFKDVFFSGALIGDSGERKKLSPWSVYRTAHSSGFTTQAAKFMRMPGTTTQTVYFGGSAGQIFDLNGTGVLGDGGVAGVAGDYLYLPGIDGNYASAPDEAAFDITGDIDIRVHVLANDWTPSVTQVFLSKWVTTGSQRSYRFALTTTTGTPQLSTSTDGSASSIVQSTASVGAANGATLWVKVTLDVDNGAAGKDYKFYTSTDYDPDTETGTWTQLGTTVTSPGTTSIHAGTAPLEIGSADAGTTVGGVEPLDGRIFRAQVFDGINGTRVADFDPSDGDAGDTSITSANTGEVYTVNQSGEDVAQIIGDSENSSFGIQVIRKTRFIDEKDGINFLAHVTRGNVQYRRLNEVDFNIELDWGDEYNQSIASIPLKGPPVTDMAPTYGGSFYYMGEVYYNRGFTFSNKISHQNFSMVGRGSGCFMTCTTQSLFRYQVDSVTLE